MFESQYMTAQLWAVLYNNNYFSFGRVKAANDTLTAECVVSCEPVVRWLAAVALSASHVLLAETVARLLKLKKVIKG